MARAGTGTATGRLTRAIVVAALAGAALLASMRAGSTDALFTEQDAVGGNALTTGTLSVPTGVGATPACNGTAAAKVTITWNTTSPADGYDVRRALASGGPYSTVAHVNGAGTSSYVDTTVLLATTYYYRVRTTLNAWVSASSSTVGATTPSVCL